MCCIYAEHRKRTFIHQIQNSTNQPKTPPIEGYHRNPYNLNTKTKTSKFMQQQPQKNQSQIKVKSPHHNINKYCAKPSKFNRECRQKQQPSARIKTHPT